MKLNEEQQQSLLRHAEALLFGDKRKGVRKTCNIPVNYASDNRVYSNHIRNISKGGVFIETQSPLVSGEEIYMTFRLDGFERAL
ncbi:MAG: PilZ domain-containing protein, partial [Desulfobacterales bacterium]